MAWTQDDYDALKAAVRSGTRRVRYADKEVEYHSLADMRALLAEMAAGLNPNTAAGTRSIALEYSAD